MVGGTAHRTRKNYFLFHGTATRDAVYFCVPSRQRPRLLSPGGGGAWPACARLTPARAASLVLPSHALRLALEIVLHWACCPECRPMEMLVWLGVAAAIALLVYLAAPHHQRLIGDRPSADAHHTWD